MEEFKESTQKTCPETGEKIDRSSSNWLLWLMPITGFFALLWFLIRVIPKPSRAAYPCQRVAFPIASAFVIWLTGLVGSAVAMKKARVLVRDRRFLSALFFVTVAVMAISLPITYHAPLGISAYPDDQTDQGWYDPFDSPENLPLDPKGVPAGINPGRVVWNYSPDATSWNGTSGYFINYIDQAVVDQMLSDTLLDLVEAETEADAWDQLFKHYNGGTGYVAGQKIAIKLNLNRSGSHSSIGNYGQIAPQMVLALLKQLVYNAYVDDDDIIFYEASKAITNDIFDLCRNYDGDDPDSDPDFPDVHFADSKGNNGRDPIVMDSSAQMIWSDDLLDPTEDGTPPEDMYLPECVTQAYYLINLGSLKGHDLVGSTACAKNHFGTFRKLNGDAGPKPAGVHPYIAVHSYQINASWWLDQSPMGTYSPLVDIMGHEHLGGKTILYLLDGLYVAHAQNREITADNKWQTKPFGNGIGSGSDGWSSILLASQDPVAIESVALDFLRSEPAIQDYYSLDAGDTVDNYLHEAAEADSPPSGHVYDYDPVGTGTPLDSLGVHEHWNNEIKRQYSGNLKTDDGIELIRSPRVWGDINGGGVDVEDLVFIANNWLRDDCGPSNGWCDGADINQDDDVNLEDYAHVSADWGIYVAGETYSYQLTVNSGTGSGVYPYGTVVGISADPPPTDYVFDAWVGDIAYVANSGASTTTVTIPNGNIEVTATYVLAGSAPVPVAHWTFDDGSGSDVLDSSGNDYHATATDGTWVTGASGDAMDFNGSTSTVALPVAAFDTISGGNEVSISMWVHGDAASQPRKDTVFRAADGSDRVLNIHVPWDNETVYWDAGGAGSSTDRITKQATESEYEGQWNHWVFTKNAVSGAMTIYLNGAWWHDNGGTPMTKVIGDIDAASIGSTPVTTIPYDGMIDDVKLYDVELTAPEVADLYADY